MIKAKVEILGLSEDDALVEYFRKLIALKNDTTGTWAALFNTKKHQQRLAQIPVMEKDLWAAFNHRFGDNVYYVSHCKNLGWYVLRRIEGK